MWCFCLFLKLLFKIVLIIYCPIYLTGFVGKNFMLCNNTKFGKHKLQFKSIPIYNQIYSDILFYNEIFRYVGVIWVFNLSWSLYRKKDVIEILEHTIHFTAMCHYRNYDLFSPNKLAVCSTCRFNSGITTFINKNV